MAKGQANIENLRPGMWKKGQSGNPKGRPPVRPMTSTLKNLMERILNLDQHPITHQKNVKLSVREVMILALIKKALKGDTDAQRMIWERVDGKVPIPMDHTGVTIQLATVIEYIRNPDKLMEVIASPELLTDESEQHGNS